MVFSMALLNYFFLVETPQLKGLEIKERSALIENSEVANPERDEEAQIAQILETRGQARKRSTMGYLEALKIPGVIAFSLSFFLIKMT